MNGPYSALDDLEAIRIRPDHVIGGTENPNHLLTELFDNALDEIINNRADKCSIIVDDDVCQICDNGKGIKKYDMTLPDGRIKDSIHTLCTELHSGSKFNTNDYKILIGQHGVGLVAINALTEYLIIHTRGDYNDRSNMYTYTFVNSILQKIEINKSELEWSTIIEFKPNSKYFRQSLFDIKPIAQRLLLVQSKFNNSQFWFNNKQVTKLDFVEFVKNCINVKKNVELYKLSYSIDVTTINVYITFTQDRDSTIIGEVNTRLCEGTFITNFQTLLGKLIVSKLKLKNIKHQHTLIGLKCYIEITIPEPTFDGQSKQRMVSDIKDLLISPLENQLNWFLDQKDILSIIESNISNKRITNTKQIVSTYKRLSEDNKTVDSMEIPGETLYLLEGIGARGTCLEIRNENEGVSVVSGKILNVEKATLDKIEDSKNIMFLLEAIGPRNKRRYNNIAILADADVDGYHIIVLVLIFLYKYCDDYINNGKIKVIFPPQYGAFKKNKFIPLYDINNIKYYKDNNYEIIRFKGLGEMSPPQLDHILRNGLYYTLKPVDTNTFSTLMSIIKTNLKKSIINNNQCSFNNLLNKILIPESNNRKEI